MPFPPQGINTINTLTNPVIQGTVNPGTGLTLPAFSGVMAGALGATCYVVANNAKAEVKAHAQALHDAGYPVWVCDGTDDQVEIQAAIDALPAGGGKVMLAEGTFTTTAPITLRSNISLEGVGPSSIVRLKDGTITVAGVGGLLRMIHSPGTSASPIKNISIKNFRVDGNIAGQVGGAWTQPIGLYFTNYFTISDMFILNSYTAIEPWDSSHGIISNNHIRDVIIGDSIGPLRSDYLTIIGNICENAHEGIDLEFVNSSIVSGNVIRATTRPVAGVWVRGGSNNTISNNIIIGHPTLKDHFVSKGVWIRTSAAEQITNYNTVTGNVIRHMHRGIETSGANNVVQGNTIENITEIGILAGAPFGTGNRVIIAQNLLYNIARHGIFAEGSFGGRDVLIQGNLLGSIGTKTHHTFSGIVLAAGMKRVNVANNVISSEEPTNRLLAGIFTFVNEPHPPAMGRIETNNLRHSGALHAIINDWPDSLIMSEAKFDLFMDVLAASTTHIHPAITPDGLAHTDVTSSDVPRNAMLRITNTDGVNPQTPSGGNIIIEGVDARGRTTSETLVVPATSILPGGTSDIFGSKAFATVSKVTYYSEMNTAITVSIGISNKLGLSNLIYATEDVYKVKKNNADVAVGTVDTANGTVDCATIVSGDDFTVYYRSNLNILT